MRWARERRGREGEEEEAKGGGPEEGRRPRSPLPPGVLGTGRTRAAATRGMRWTAGAAQSCAWGRDVRCRSGGGGGERGAGRSGTQAGTGGGRADQGGGWRGWETRVAMGVGHGKGRAAAGPRRGGALTGSQRPRVANVRRPTKRRRPTRHIDTWSPSSRRSVHYYGTGLAPNMPTASATTTSSGYDCSAAATLPPHLKLFPPD